MAKKQEHRAGEPAHVNIPAKYIESIDDDGEVHLNEAGLKHVKAHRDEAADAKAKGQKEVANAHRDALEPFALTNTTARVSVIGIDSMAWGEMASGGFGTIGGGPRLIVHRSHKGDSIELNRVKYPVSDKWADAFDAMLAANGAGVGLTAIVGKTTRAIEQLPPELQAILMPLPGNKGYVLRLK